MLSKIMEIINEWNPIEIHPLLEDEYKPEAEEIEIWLVENENPSTADLVDHINQIFIKYFGNSLYIVDNNQAVEAVAKKILENE